MNLTAFIQINDKTRAGIKTQLTSTLNIFSNPMIDAATCENDFDLHDLRKKKMTVYVAVSPDNLTRLAPLINMFFQMVIDLNTKVQPQRNDPIYRYQVMLLMDEFTSLGRMQIIADSIAFIRSYGLQLVPIIQSDYQLHEKYGHDGAKNIIKNFQARVFFPPDNMEDAEIISRELGTRTVKQKAYNMTRGFEFGNGNVTTSETKRALMLPQEIKELSDRESILLIKGCRPIKAKRYFYYEKTSPFIERVIPPIKIPPLTINHHETRGKVEMEYLVDFNSIEIDEPQSNDQPLSAAELDNAADQFWSSMKNVA